MKIAIEKYEERPPEFWALMGPFFAQRRYRREMPYLVDDDGYVWFLAVENEAVLGFGSVHETKDCGVLSGLYVAEKHRGNGVARKLIDARLQWCKEKELKKAKTTASPDSKPIFEKAGFAVTGTKGQYTTMEVELDAYSFRDAKN
ncbi:MAG: GNAT family N-acetyltransferase [Synergistaceae bacterium]|jgi:GNAT superfamily N-acetyltransferase|nr:GNAT family N-acetyltransferase [Synergistaceae bacterium]